MTTTTPENLTFETIKTWDGPTMRDQMHKPEMREAILRVVASRQLSEVEAAQVSIESNQPTVVETPVEQPVVVVDEEAKRAEAREAAIKAEDEQLATVGISVIRDQYGNVSKLIQDYQATDENGNPIGRPTHLEARSWPEMSIKQKEAHIQATRAFHRLKTQKITFKEQPAAAPTEFSDADLLAAMKDIKSDDPTKQLEAIRKVQKAEADKAKAEYDRKLAEAEELRRQERVSLQFLARHKEDFNNCEANVKMIATYFEENQLAWTNDNLEIAFQALESELAPVEKKPVVSATPDNPVRTAPVAQPVTQPAASATATQVAPAAVQPQATTTAQVTPAANPQATARPGVNGGLVPGESSGSRPVSSSQPKGLTAEEIKSWDGPTMRAKMRDPKIRPQIEAFIASRQQTRK